MKTQQGASQPNQGRQYKTRREKRNGWRAPKIPDVHFLWPMSGLPRQLHRSMRIVLVVHNDYLFEEFWYLGLSHTSPEDSLSLLEGLGNFSKCLVKLGQADREMQKPVMAQVTKKRCGGRCP